MKDENLLRKQRLKTFEEEYLITITEQPICERVIVMEKKFIIYFTDGMIIDFYPMADKVMIHGKTTWINYGLEWLLNKVGMPYEDDVSREKSLIARIAIQVQSEYQMSGLAEGLYLDFATEVAIRYAKTKTT